MIIRRLWIVIALAALVAVLAAANSLFVVDQSSQAIVERLGRPVRVINPPGANDPGLKLKAPWEQLVRLDKRDQGFDADPTELTAADQQKLTVQAVLRYRIDDALAFTGAFASGDAAHDRMNQLVAAALKQTLSQAGVADIIAGRQDALIAQATALVATQARTEKLGFEVIDVRLRRVELPDANAQAVYQRMKSERDLVAVQTRAVGDQRRRDIMADADRQVAAITADGDAQAAQARAAGDAERAQVFAASYGRDPSLAAFYKGLMANEATLTKGNTTVVLSPDSPFLKYMKQGPGGH